MFESFKFTIFLKLGRWTSIIFLSIFRNTKLSLFWVSVCLPYLLCLFNFILVPFLLFVWWCQCTNSGASSPSPAFKYCLFLVANESCAPCSPPVVSSSHSLTRSSYIFINVVFKLWVFSGSPVISFILVHLEYTWQKILNISLPVSFIPVLSLFFFLKWFLIYKN